MIPLHPVATADPDRLRWVVPADPVPGRGRVRRAPAPLQALLTAGVLSAVELGAGCVETVLGPGWDWPTAGPRVRTALHAALASPDWAVAESGGEDGALRAAATAALAEVAPYVAGHGGSLELVDVTAGVVTVRMHGACHGCPAAAMTLGARVTGAIRRRFPGEVEVAAAPAGPWAAARARAGRALGRAG